LIETLAQRSPLPRWLADRAGWRFRFTRGARGYALLSPPDLGTGTAADCAQPIDLVLASGRVCGRVTLHTALGGCGTGIVDQGWDGTVIQDPWPRKPMELVPQGKVYGDCTFVFWPKMLE
jgi:hypothetical protein